VIRLYVQHPEDEKDLVQEITFQAWKSLPGFKGDSKFSTWLYRVALNTVLSFKRRAQIVTPVADLSALNAASRDINFSDETEALYVAIRSLPEIDRIIVTLHLEGYQNEEIASITGLSKNNTAVKLHRIKDSLIKRLRYE